MNLSATYCDRCGVRMLNYNDYRSITSNSGYQEEYWHKMLCRDCFRVVDEELSYFKHHPEPVIM